jgi:signal transduction histidine kinase
MEVAVVVDEESDGPLEEQGPDTALMAKALAALYLAGATMVLLTLVLPHDADPNEVGSLTIVAYAYLLSAGMIAFANRLSLPVLAVLLGIGTVSITGVAYFSGKDVSPLIFFYLWVMIYSAYFFSARVAVAEIVWVGISFGLLLAVADPAGGESWWVVGMGSMLVAVGLVAVLRQRGEIMVASLRRNVREREKAQQSLTEYRDHLEELVEERTAALQVANRELEAFSYSVSHDLRSPLRSLDGFSQALVEDYGEVLEAEGQDYLKRIRTASQRMARLIDDMLLLSRLSRGDMNRGEIDVSALAQEVVTELRETYPERDVDVVIEPGLVANADQRLLRVLLQNLVGNAWKFTAKQEKATIHVAHSNGDVQAFMVRDDGVGFDMAYADKLFGAFQRLHSAGEFEGTGIGLATVQRIVHRHGGRVWAESELGAGATFFFTLPRTRMEDGEQNDSAG